MRRALPVIVAGVAYFAAALVWIGSDRRIAQSTFDTFSSANTSPAGLSLAMKYLSRSGRRHVNMLTTPVDDTLPANAVVFRVMKERELTIEQFFRMMGQQGDDDEDQDETPPRGRNAKKKPKIRLKHATPMLSTDEELFIRNGGRFILATTGLPEVFSTRNATSSQAVKVFPIWPGIEQIAMPEARTLQGPRILQHAHALYVIGEEPAIARMPIGDGDLILVATPELFDNEHVGRHLDLLTALTANRRNIFFDETVHGLLSGGGTIDLLRRWRLGPMLFLLLVVAIVVIWRGAHATGTREDDYREMRNDAVDLVSSLGALYDSTMSYAEAIALYHQAFTQSVAAQTGLRGEQLQKRVALLTNDMRPPRKSERMEVEEFNRSLSTLNESFRRLEHAEHH